MNLFMKLLTGQVSRWFTVKKGAQLELEAGATLKAAGTTITAEELARNASTSSRAVPLTAATATLAAATYDGKTTVLSRAAGQALTLDAATGSGSKINLVLLTTVTSNTTTVKAAGTDKLQGLAMVATGTTTVTNSYKAGASDNTVTLNGTTTGGYKGDRIVLEDIAAGVWQVNVTSGATGTVATPFSAT